MPDSQHRLLFTGPFHADHRARALDALCARADANARDILYIVASAAAKRRAISDLLARRDAIFGFHIITLRGLAAELARRAHAKEPARVSGVVDELLVEREIRSASGSRFRGATPVSGLAAKAASTIDLLERNGATPSAFRGFLDQSANVGDGARMLAQAWGGLAVKRPHYGRTEAGMLAEAVELLQVNAGVLDGLDVLVLEDLSLLTAMECAVVCSLVARAPAHVIASHGFVGQLADAPSSRSLRSLRELASWTETRCAPIDDNRTALLRRLFAASDTTSAVASSNGTVPAIRMTRLESNGDLGEVRTAARVVRRHLDAGVAPEHIALVAHGAGGRYRELVREVFGAARIPVAVALPRTLAETGIGSVLLQLLELAIVPERMTRETSLAVARAPHVGLRTRSADRLHQQVVNAGFLGLDGWTELATKTLGEHAANRVNRLKRAVATARSGFESVSSPAQAARVVRQLAKELHLLNNAYFERRRSARSSYSPQRADSVDALSSMTALAVREDSLAWEATVTDKNSVLDTTVPTMLEIDRVSAGKSGLEYAAAWLAMLTRVMHSDTVTPERAPAHAVQFHGTGPGCEAPARVTIVLGLLEKIFPRQPRQDPFLDDELRTALSASFGWLLPTTVDAVDRERECFIRAISSATEALYLSYAATDAEGRPGVRSFFVDDLQAAAGEHHPIGVEHSGATTAIANVSDAVSASGLLTAISHDVWQYLPRTTDVTGRRGAAFRALDALARREQDVSPVRHGRRVSQTPDLAGVLPVDAPHLTLRLSASQLKTISHCTYEHFVQKVLDPSSIAAPEYNALTKGSLIHDAIMHWATALDGWNRGEAALTEIDEWVRGRVEQWSPAQRGTTKTARTMAADLERLNEFLREELRDAETPGVGRPTFAELAFGEEPNAAHGPRDAASRVETFPLQLKTSTGLVTVQFRGSMDRVDVVTVDDRQYAVIIDYKSGKNSEYYANAMMRGEDLQLRLYLLVLQEFWNITPIGALYLGFGDGVRRGAIRADFADRFAGMDRSDVKRLAVPDWQGFVDETHGLVTRLVDRLVKLDVTPAPRDNKCGFCRLTPVCRYDRWAPTS